MNFLRIASLAVLLLAVNAARSEKKIELQDIEEDNLKSEQENVPDETITPQPHLPESDRNLVSLDILKRGHFGPSFQFQDPPLLPQQARYVHQYAVNEPSEKLSGKFPNVLTAAATPQSTAIGYLSDMPMHIYLIPQGYGEQTEGTVNSPTAAAVQGSYNEPALSSLTSNYVEVPTYLVPTGKGYMHQYTPRVTYVNYDPHSAANPANPHLTVLTGSSTDTGISNPSAPLISYNVPTPHFPYQMIQREYYSTQQVEANEMEDPCENGLDEPIHYNEQTKAPDVEPYRSQYSKYNKKETQLRNKQPTSAIEPTRENYPLVAIEKTSDKYRSGAIEPPRDKHPSDTLKTLRDNHPSGVINELPTPNPLLLKGSTSSIPKALPYYRPTSKPVYGTVRYSLDHNAQKPSNNYAFLKKYPNSLLDSYIPSKLQVEYMKKSYNKDPLSAYEALSSSRQLYSHPHAPRTYERGFLPNQMYHTAAGGVTFERFKKIPITGTIAYN